MSSAEVVEVPELLPEHADGSTWADVQGHLWDITVFGWLCTAWLPFGIVSQNVQPTALYGPYRRITEPPIPRDVS